MASRNYFKLTYINGSSDQDHFFLNLCRKKSDPTSKDSDFEWRKFQLILSRSRNSISESFYVRLLPTLNSKIKWLGSELPLRVPLSLSHKDVTLFLKKCCNITCNRHKIKVLHFHYHVLQTGLLKRDLYLQV